MLNKFVATKINNTQAWNEAGKRHAVTVLKASPAVVTQLKDKSKDGYDAIQVGLGMQKAARIGKPQSAYYKKIKLNDFPMNTREIKVEDSSLYQIGQQINNPFEVGDIVNAQGITKGRGFAGVIKRWGFRGGPKTHGQSDRGRAPGSIGQGTDPGRVHRGKKMPGHYGQDTKTIRNLIVLHVDNENHEIWLSGPIPGVRNDQIVLTKVGHKASFSPLKTDKVISEVEQKPEEEVVETVNTPEQSTESKQE